MKKCFILLAVLFLIVSAQAFYSIKDDILAGRVHRVKMWLKQDPFVVYWRGKTGYTPLHWATAINHQEITQILINAGANVNARTKMKETPLHLVDDKKIAEMLLQEEADVNARDEHRQTPLHRAVTMNHIEKAMALIEAGANIKAKDVDKNTPLHLAVAEGHIEMVPFFINKGANVNASKSKRRNPSSFSRR